MKKGLLFAGAFNPVTVAHLYCALSAVQKTGRDYVMFVPSKETYIRFDQKKDYVYSDENRFAMLKRIADTHKEVLVSDYELKNDHQPRTYETLCALKQQGYQCSLLFGTDKLVELSTAWKHVKEIADQFGIVCMTRNHTDIQSVIEKDPLLKEIQDHIEIVETEENLQDISSSTFRKLMKENRRDEAMLLVPEEIRDMKEIDL